MSLLFSGIYVGYECGASFEWMALSFVTTNPGKYREVGLILDRMGIKIEHAQIDVPEIQSMDQAEVLKEKAKAALSLVDAPFLLEDTGLYLSAYDRFPGVFSKQLYHMIGFSGFFRLLEGQKKGALLVTIVGFMDDHGRLEVFEAKTKGNIVDRVPEMEDGFDAYLPYNHIFRPEGSEKVLFELEGEEFLRFSQRRKAFEAFGAWYITRS